MDGSGGDALCMPAGGSLRPASHETVDQRLHYVKQDGQTVFRFAVRNTEEACRRDARPQRRQAGEIDLFVSHQANRRIIQSAAEKLGMPPEKVVINIEQYGNTTAATIPLALNDAVEHKRLKRGDLLLLVSVGAGFTVGAVLSCAGGLKDVGRPARCRFQADVAQRPTLAAARPRGSRLTNLKDVLAGAGHHEGRLCCSTTPTSRRCCCRTSRSRDGDAALSRTAPSASRSS